MDLKSEFHKARKAAIISRIKKYRKELETLQEPQLSAIRADIAFHEKILLTTYKTKM